MVKIAKICHTAGDDIFQIKLIDKITTTNMEEQLFSRFQLFPLLTKQ